VGAGTASLLNEQKYRNVMGKPNKGWMVTPIKWSDQGIRRGDEPWYMKGNFIYNYIINNNT
jgi:hypothetical protein